MKVLTKEANLTFKGGVQSGSVISTKTDIKITYRHGSEVPTVTIHTQQEPPTA